MKKLRILLLLPMLLLVSCSNGTTGDDREPKVTYFWPNFDLVCTHGFVSYLKDLDTNIMYISMSDNTAHKRSGCSVYYNAEGKPMTYEEFKTVHTAKYH